MLFKFLFRGFPTSEFANFQHRFVPDIGLKACFDARQLLLPWEDAPFSQVQLRGPDLKHMVTIFVKKEIG